MARHAPSYCCTFAEHIPDRVSAPVPCDQCRSAKKNCAFRDGKTRALWRTKYAQAKETGAPNKGVACARCALKKTKCTYTMDWSDGDNRGTSVDLDSGAESLAEKSAGPKNIAAPSNKPRVRRSAPVESEMDEATEPQQKKRVPRAATLTMETGLGKYARHLQPAKRQGSDDLHLPTTVGETLAVTFREVELTIEEVMLQRRDTAEVGKKVSNLAKQQLRLEAELREMRAAQTQMMGLQMELLRALNRIDLAMGGPGVSMPAPPATEKADETAAPQDRNAGADAQDRAAPQDVQVDDAAVPEQEVTAPKEDNVAAPNEGDGMASGAKDRVEGEGKQIQSAEVQEQRGDAAVPPLEKAMRVDSKVAPPAEGTTEPRTLDTASQEVPAPPAPPKTTAHVSFRTPSPTTGAEEESDLTDPSSSDDEPPMVERVAVPVSPGSVAIPAPTELRERKGKRKADGDAAPQPGAVRPNKKAKGSKGKKVSRKK